MRAAGFEPTVANSDETPCRFEQTSAQTFAVPGLFTAGADRAETSVAFRNSALAQVSVGALDIPAFSLQGGPFTASAVHTSARAYCTSADQPPTLAVDRWEFQFVSYNTPVVSVVAPDGITFDAGPLGKVVFNEIVREPNRITIRGVHYTGPAGDVIAAESSVGFVGNPCVFFGH